MAGDAASISSFGLVQEAVRAIRNLRSEKNVRPGQRIPATIACGEHLAMLQSQSAALAALASLDLSRLTLAESLPGKPDGHIALVVGPLEIYLPLAGLVDLEEERTPPAKRAGRDRRPDRAPGKAARQPLRRQSPARRCAEGAREARRVPGDRGKTQGAAGEFGVMQLYPRSHFTRTLAPEKPMSQLKWWQTAVFYQIYPRSFADGNGDGIGDFQGMIARLDYLKELGVDALWLSPHFPSPNWDCGYDISDYCDVAPEYGTLDEFKTFLNETHARGMRLILDLVLNHTSDEHPWFIESKSSRDNPKADWYVWASTPPNNWQSCFDGEAWTYAPERGEYYYHYFMKQQPDLNWRNPAVKQAMWDAVRFWLEMGVDGFRLDAIGTIYEDPDIDAPRLCR